MNRAEAIQRFDIDAEATIVVETTSGDASVQGWDEPGVGVVTEGDSGAVAHEGQTLKVKSHHGGSEDLHVKVPRNVRLALHLVSGDARLEDVAGEVTVQTMSGDIQVRNLQGEVQIHTVSGDVRVRASHLTRAALDSVSGDLLLESALVAEGHYQAGSVSGDVKLLVPEDQRCTVHAHSLSGDFSFALRHELRHQGWGRVEAAINGGGVAVNIHTTSGNIAVQAAGALPEAQEAPRPAPVASASAPGPVERETHTLAEEPAPASPSASAEPFGIAPSSQQPVSSDPAAVAARRMEILKDIEEGRLSVTEGLTKLRALD